MKNIDIIGGGTVFHVRNHLALCAPAYGKTARLISSLCHKRDDAHFINMHLTKMADPEDRWNSTQRYGLPQLETNQDISNLVDKLIENKQTKIIFFNPALVDFEGAITVPGPQGYEWGEINTPSGKYETRLQTSKGDQTMLLWPAPKILGKIRKERKDIFLVAFKTTCGATSDEQFLTGLHLLKTNSCNLVLANDTKTRNNIVITPEQARYYETTDRDKALHNLVEMALARSQGTFTRSRVVTGRGIPWTSETVPASLREVVNYCIGAGAYKPFNGSTVGHFAAKIDEKKFMTSMRKSNFNMLEELAYVHAEDDDKVISQGGKPSVGGQSQRIVFKEHPEMDCIVHFHCPMRKHPEICQHTIPVKNQAPFECGSHQCGQNTSSGLQELEPGIKCVYLDNHGPNIVFHHSIDPKKVIMFIERNFDLSKSTDGVDRSITKQIS